MLRQSFLFLVILLLSKNYCLGQLPSPDDLFNYDKNHFFTAGSEVRHPFLIVVTANQLDFYKKIHKQVFVRYMQKEVRLFDSLEKDKTFRSIRTVKPRFVPVFDSTKSLVFVQGITKKNAGEYEYRIFENNKPNNNWKPVTQFYNETYVSGYGEDDPEMATLGYLDVAWNNYLTIDVRRKSTDSIFSTAVLLRLPHPPKVIGTFTAGELNRFMKVFNIRSKMEGMGLDLPDDDSLLKTRHEFASAENTIIFYLDDVIKQKIVEYKLEGEGVSEPWKLNELDFNFIWLQNLKPGKYRLFIRYSIQRHNVTEYDFEIRPAWQQTTWFKILAGSLIAAFFGFIIVLIRIRRQRHHLQTEQLKKEKIDTELKAIRSQLNPHFIFNSLNSIQSLVTRNEIENANSYLTRFAALMRNTLSASDKTFNSLAEEIGIVETYLSLEKLRFNFSYEINVSDNIDRYATSLPSLLLQPLAENAVKHGMEKLKEGGVIQLKFWKEENNLLLTVFNNGPVFTLKENKGYGLKLLRDRILLLNRTLKGQRITQQIEGVENKGTTVRIEFQNWFL